MKKGILIGAIIIIVVCVWLMIANKSKNDDKTVVIYTSAEDYRNADLIEMAKEQFPDLDIQVQYLPTGNNAAKLKAEGKDTEADIVLDLERAHAENLKDIFMDLEQFDTSNYIDGINPEHNKYFTWVKYSATIIINTDVIKEKGLSVPKSYQDLLKPEYKGLIAMPDPKTSGTGYMVYKNVLNLMGKEEGMKYFDELQKNIKEFTTSGSGPIKLLNQKEIAIGIGMISQAVTEINNGAHLEIIPIDTGVPYNTTTIAIIDGKQSNENVIKVFEWLINEFSKYDKENYFPELVLKEQKNNIANYPANIEYGDMAGIDDVKEKEILTEEWKY